MTLGVLELTFKRIFETSLVGDDLEVAWHAGEPLTVPLSWYEEAFAIAEKQTPPSVRLVHRLQTNGLLLNHEWADLFSRARVKVGLSIDGPADMHDYNRRTRHGQGTHERAMRAVKLLQGRGISFTVITVLTDRTLDDPDRLFHFYVRNGIREVGFNVEEIEGPHAKSSLQNPGSEDRYRLFIKRFLDLVWSQPNAIRVREFENAISALLSPKRIRDEQNEPLAILSVAYDGKFSTFSPELLGARLPRYIHATFGNVLTDKISDVRQAPLFRAINSEIRRGVRACQRDCAYFKWCGGGVPANKVFETGRFDTQKTMHCRLTQQILLDEVLAKLEGLTHSGAKAKPQEAN